MAKTATSAPGFSRRWRRGILVRVDRSFGLPAPAVKTHFHRRQSLRPRRRDPKTPALTSCVHNWLRRFGCEGRQLWTERIFVVLLIGHAHAAMRGGVRGACRRSPFIVSETTPGEIHDYLVKRLPTSGHPEIHHQAVGRDNLMRLILARRGLTVTKRGDHQRRSFRA